MWAHFDMKVQIPHLLLLTRYVGTVCGMQHGCCPASSLAIARFLGASLAERSTPTQDAKAGFLLLTLKNSVSGDL